MKQTILSILFLLTSSSYAQEKFEFTIEQAAQYAIENNNDLSKAQLDQEIIDAQVAEVRGRALPQITASSRFSDNFSLAEQQLPAEIVGGEPGTTVGVKFGNRYNFTAGVDVQQELLNFQLFNSLRSVSALEELQKLNTLKTTEDLVINVIQVYIQVQVTEKQIELLEENYERTNSLVELSGLKLEEGIIRKLDLNQLKVNLTNLSTQIEDAKFNKNEQIRLFKLYLNIPMNAEVLLTEKIEDRPANLEEQTLVVESMVEYRQLQKQLFLSEIDQNLSRSEALPKLNAFFNYNYQGNSNEFEFTQPVYQDFYNGTWGLSLSMPIFDGFQRRSRVQQKKIETLKLKEDEEYLTANIQKQFEDAKEQKELSETQIKNQKENMELASENYEGTKLSYSEGVAPLNELLDTEFALRQAQSNYLNALLQSKVSELKLLKASGTLSNLITNNNYQF